MKGPPDETDSASAGGLKENGESYEPPVGDAGSESYGTLP